MRVPRGTARGLEQCGKARKGAELGNDPETRKCAARFYQRYRDWFRIRPFGRTGQLMLARNALRMLGGQPCG